ncbi:MAG: flagellar basal-body MS-ring/collar protein FliF [Peptococcaceae bacterium]
MNFLQQLREQISNIWRNLNKLQRIVVVGSSLLVAGVLIFSSFLLNKTNYEPLYPDLNINDSALISAKLKEMKVDYDIGEDGTTILVPQNLKHQLRLDLANQLPQGGVIGFESFNETRFGETDTDKRIRYLAALQGELTRTIQGMAEVETAKVHVVLPEETVFIRDSKPATASVLLKLKPYSTMDLAKVKSIVLFLSHSVEGLAPENVTVIDVYGNLLSDGINEESGELVSAKLTINQMEIKKQYEDGLSKSLQSMLEKVMGQGRAVVRASAEMDFDQVETSREEFGDKVLRSEQIREESSEGTTNPDSGVAGSESNLTDAISYQNAESGETSTESSEAIRNYEINKSTETRKKAPGEIKRLSVAVIIDGQLTTDEESNIRNIIAGAAGINEARDDSIEITSLPFNTQDYSNLQEQMDREISRQNMMELVKYGVLGLGILAMFAVVFLLLRRSVSRAVQPQVTSQQLAPKAEDVYNNLSPEEQEKIEVQKRIEKIAKTQPENVAKVVKTWLAEDSR